MITYNFYCLNDSCDAPKNLIKINLEKKDSNKGMYCDVCNKRLKKVGQQTFTVMGSESERYIKQSNHFKQISKNHAKTEESKHLRRKVIDTQFGVMGMEKIENKKKK